MLLNLDKHAEPLFVSLCFLKHRISHNENIILKAGLKTEQTLANHIWVMIKTIDNLAGFTTKDKAVIQPICSI